jgi:hypothetical protein
MRLSDEPAPQEHFVIFTNSFVKITFTIRRVLSEFNRLALGIPIAPSPGSE